MVFEEQMNVPSPLRAAFVDDPSQLDAGALDHVCHGRRLLLCCGSCRGVLSCTCWRCRRGWRTVLDLVEDDDSMDRPARRTFFLDCGGHRRVCAAILLRSRVCRGERQKLAVLNIVICEHALVCEHIAGPDDVVVVARWIL